MEFTTFGRTGFRVSVVGMGCGGASRLGRPMATVKNSRLLWCAWVMELGINYIDTAEAYKTEEIVGKAIAGVPRDQIFLSTKKNPYKDGVPVSADELISGCEASLRRLGTDYVGMSTTFTVPTQAQHVKDELVPALLRLKEQGKIRATAVSENFGTDTQHGVLLDSFWEDVWDVTMVGFNILNQTATKSIFPITQTRALAQSACLPCAKPSAARITCGPCWKILVEKGKSLPRRSTWTILWALCWPRATPGI